jgi:hypothetical protein
MRSNWKKCVILGCGKLAHNHGKNVPGTYCSSHQKIRAKLEKPLVCDNHKGYLGYYCSATIVDQCQIHIDHWDGDRRNNDRENIKYLCANCHSYKTALLKDYLNRYNNDEDKKKNDWSELPLLHKQRQDEKQMKRDIFSRLFEED